MERSNGKSGETLRVINVLVRSGRSVVTSVAESTSGSTPQPSSIASDCCAMYRLPTFETAPRPIVVFVIIVFVTVIARPEVCGAPSIGCIKTQYQADADEWPLVRFKLPDSTQKCWTHFLILLLD